MNFMKIKWNLYFVICKNRQTDHFLNNDQWSEIKFKKSKITLLKKKEEGETKRRERERKKKKWIWKE